MTELIKVEPFKAKFENIDINVVEMTIDEKMNVINEIFPADTPYTGLWHTMSVFYYVDYRTLDGKILLILKDQKEGGSSSLFIEGIFIVTSPEKAYSADIFAKFIQYLFDWLHKYLKDNKIKDKSAEDFILPAFPYSRAHFESAFPEVD